MPRMTGIKLTDRLALFTTRPVEIVFVDLGHLTLRSIDSGRTRNTLMEGAECTCVPRANGPIGMTITRPNKSVLILEIPVPVITD
jgi:hypothetical protein